MRCGLRFWHCEGHIAPRSAKTELGATYIAADMVRTVRTVTPDKRGHADGRVEGRQPECGAGFLSYLRLALLWCAWRVHTVSACSGGSGRCVRRREHS